MIRPSVMTEREAADMSESEEKLFGVTPEMEKGFQKLKEIFDKEVFELYIRQGQGYVPYMMNDALGMLSGPDRLQMYRRISYRIRGEYPGISVIRRGREDISCSSGRREYFYPLVQGDPDKTGRLSVPPDRPFLAGGKGTGTVAAAGLYAGNGLRQV